MNNKAVVSVVIGVYNGEAALPSTLDSIFSQQNIALECIVVDDGSTDGTLSLLKQRAIIEPRLRILRQEHGGLTKALIHGCAQAKGDFIARQDVGDLSLSGRLYKQYELLSSNMGLAFVACPVQTVGPQGENLGETGFLNHGVTIIESLINPTKNGMSGPHHGSVMFRRSCYEQAGGYRHEFYFAQDLDLWARLIELGKLEFHNEVLYQSRFAPSGVTAFYRPQQVVLRDLIRQTTLLRRNGEPEEQILRKAAAIRPEALRAKSGIDGSAEYFIGSCLYQRGDPAAATYLRKSISANPFNLKAWVKLMGCKMNQLY